MKRYRLLLIALLFSGRLLCQDEYGVAGMITVVDPWAIQEISPLIFTPHAGLRAEYLRTRLSMDRFRNDYLGLSCSVFPAHSNDVDFHVDRYDRGSSIDSILHGSVRRSEFHLNGRAGWHIPQRWTSVISLDIGLQAGVFLASQQLKIPEYDHQVYTMPAARTFDMSENQKGGGGEFGYFISCFYPTPRFNVFLQLEVMSTIGLNIMSYYAFALHGGIYYELGGK